VSRQGFADDLAAAGFTRVPKGAGGQVRCSCGSILARIWRDADWIMVEFWTAPTKRMIAIGKSGQVDGMMTRRSHLVGYPRRPDVNVDQWLDQPTGSLNAREQLIVAAWWTGEQWGPLRLECRDHGPQPASIHVLLEALR